MRPPSPAGGRAPRRRPRSPRAWSPPVTQLEVDHALAERVQGVGADDRVERDAGLARAGADLADELALQRLLVELALAGDDRARGAHALVEVERVEDERGARLERRRRGRPTGRRRGRRRRRSSGRRGGRAGTSAASSSSRLPSRFNHLRVGALLRAEDLGARSQGTCDVDRTTILAPRRPPASSIASSAPAPPSVVAEPPTATRTTCAPAPDRVGDQLAGAVGVAAQASRSSSATSDSPHAAAISTSAVPPSSISP